MKAKKEIREERTDVVSFWVDKKVLNENDEIVIVEEKVDECTVIELEKRIVDFYKQIEETNAKIAVENEKLALANELII